MGVRSGLAELRGYLEANPTSVRDLDLEGFRRWVADQIENARGDEVFEQRCRIRDLVRRHRRALSARGAQVGRWKKAYAGSPHRERLEALDAEIESVGKGVAGLEGAVAEGRTSDPEATRRKLGDYRERLAGLEDQRRSLLVASPERVRLDRARASLEAFRESIGLAEEDRKLEGLGRARGARSGSKGVRFEEIAGQAIDGRVRPRFEGTGARVERLSGVTLGCARAELDHVLVAVGSGDAPVEVLAVVEVKRNPNDLAEGFLTRQENLAWFRGESDRYDPEIYRTQVYREGHFDREAIHEAGGARYRFDRSSFRRFRRDPGTDCYLEGLFFVTAARRLLGVTSEERSRILYRVSTDPSFDLSSDASVRDLRRWVRSILGPRETRDVLEMYARDEGLAEQILFCEWRRD